MDKENVTVEYTYKGKSYSKEELVKLINNHYDAKFGISQQLNNKNYVIREYVKEVNEDCEYCISKDPEILEALICEPTLKSAIDGILYRERSLAKLVDHNFKAYKDIKARKGAFDAYIERQKQLTFDGNFGEDDLEKFLNQLDGSDLAPFGVEKLFEDESFSNQR